MYTTQFDHARFDLLPLAIWSRAFWPSVTGNTAMEQKRLDLRSLWPALPNLWLLLVTYQEKRPEFQNNRYCFVLLLLYCWYCCIVVLLSKVSDYSNKFRLGLSRCHLEKRAYCFNVNWKIQVDTMSHFLIRLIDLQGSVTLTHRRQKHRFSQISRQWSMS